MLSVVCFKWERNKTGMQLPYVCNYGPDHVNAWYDSLQRHLTIPHRVICVTDNPAGINPEIEIVPLWDKCREIGGCYNRLFIFSPEIQKVFGDRFVCMDLDCVIVGNLDKLFSRTDDFIINKHFDSLPGVSATQQRYNGGMIMMDTGARKQVWETFKIPRVYGVLAERKSRLELTGSDQAWISHVLGEGEKTFTSEDGVYDIRELDDQQRLPENAKIVFFPGRRDPSVEVARIGWVKDNWKAPTRPISTLSARPPIQFCTFKWHPHGDKTLPSQSVVDYSKVAADHVNRLFHSVSRNLHVPHRFVCITDDPTGLEPGIHVVPLWQDLNDMGGCWRRLKFFSKEMRELIGERLVQCDMDVVVTGDLTPLLTLPDPLILYKHHSNRHLCNGGLWIMDAGVRDDVWTKFSRNFSPFACQKEAGTDQAWLKHFLRKDLLEGRIRTVGEQEGIYDYTRTVPYLPHNCTLVQFPGGRDPSLPEIQRGTPWIKECWR